VKLLKPYYALRLGLRFLYELVASNIVVARMVLRPQLSIRPGIVAYRTDLQSEMAVAWLANLITLTPGTLTLAVSEDRKTLYIHTLDIDDPAQVVSSIRRSFESKLLELEA